MTYEVFPSLFSQTFMVEMRKTLEGSPKNDPYKASVESVLPGVQQQFLALNHGVHLVREDFKQQVEELKELTRVMAGIQGKFCFCVFLLCFHPTNIIVSLLPEPLLRQVFNEFTQSFLSLLLDQFHNVAVGLLSFQISPACPAPTPQAPVASGLA